MQEKSANNKTYQEILTCLTPDVVCEAFALILDIDTVAQNDNFFSLGGDSIQAVKLVNFLSRKFQVIVPIDLFYTRPTPKGLCDIVGGKLIDIGKTIVQLGDGTGVPVFLVHPLDGYVSAYSHLAARLSANGHPVFGLQATGLSERETQTFEEIAHCYVQELTSLFPNGPYVLIGWSLGGAIAYEMVRIFERMNIHAIFLGVIDTHPEEPNRPSEEPGLIQFAECVEWSEFDRASIAGLPEDEAFRVVLRGVKQYNIVPESVSEELFRHMVDVIVNLGRALCRYRFGAPIKSDIHLFKATNPMPDETYVVDETRWEDKTCGIVRVSEIPGNHLTVIVPPSVIDLVDAITGSVELWKHTLFN